MPYYVTPQTYTNTHNTNYSQYQSYSQNKYHGNGHTAMQWANKWYPGWKSYFYRWHNNCWWVYMKYGHYYRTVCVGQNYSWHWYKNGHWW